MKEPPKTVAECHAQIAKLRDTAATWTWVGIVSLLIWLGLPAWAGFGLAVLCFLATAADTAEMGRLLVDLRRREAAEAARYEARQRHGLKPLDLTPSARTVIDV